MIDRIKKLRDIDDEIFEDFKAATLHLPYLLNKSKFPKTTEICFMYMNGTNFLKNSIFDCAETDDLYSVNVLFRSIIEHFLRFQYFWFNHIQVKDDSYALKFRTAIDFIERIEMSKASNAVMHLNGEAIKSSDEIWNEIVNSNPDFKKFSKKEIQEFSNNLSIKNIIRYIEKTMKNGGYESNTFMKNIIIQYSRMSSFVHGGLFAHKKMIGLGNDEERHAELVSMCGLALQSASFIKEFSYLMFYQFMPEFGQIYNQTHESIKKINNHS